MITALDVRTRARLVRDGMADDALPDGVAFVVTITDDAAGCTFVEFGDEEALAAWLATFADPFDSALTISWRADRASGESAEELALLVKSLLADVPPPATLH